MKRTGWTRLTSSKLPTCFQRWLYESTQCIVEHCGHPTANFPYYIAAKDGKIHLAPNRRGFQKLKDAMDAAERL